ncbi:MAG: hypothetical protein ACPGOV_16725 [Magnetovibrionaceae bacterium]
MEAIIPIKPTARGFALTQILSKRARAAQSDVEGTKRALHALGYYDPDSENPLAHGFNGITDEALFEGIARLQSDYGLPVSGDIQPGGETERLIRSFLDHGPVSPEESDYLDMEDGEPLFFSLSRSVGFNGENRREDVQRLRDLFQSTGRYLPDRYNHGRPHKPEHLDEALHHAILTFQDEAGLTVDGLIQTAPEIPYIGDTRGETLDALTWYAGAVQEAGGPDLVDVRAYQQVRDGKTVSVSAHQRGIPGAGRGRGVQMAEGIQTNETKVEANHRAAPILEDEKERVASILADEPAVFEVAPNPDADDSSPWYESDPAGRVAVNRHKALIENEAKRQNVDPDLVKSIVYAERARGHYFGASDVGEALGLSDSVFPMNIKPETWGELGIDDETVYDPEHNIKAGVTLIRRIEDRIVDPDPAKIGSVWNYTGREKINDFGAYVGRVYNEKPWEK